MEQGHLFHLLSMFACFLKAFWISGIQYTSISDHFFSSPCGRRSSSCCKQKWKIGSKEIGAYCMKRSNVSRPKVVTYQEQWSAPYCCRRWIELQNNKLMLMNPLVWWSFCKNSHRSQGGESWAIRYNCWWPWKVYMEFSIILQRERFFSSYPCFLKDIQGQIVMRSAAW